MGCVGKHSWHIRGKSNVTFLVYWRKRMLQTISAKLHSIKAPRRTYLHGTLSYVCYTVGLSKKLEYSSVREFRVPFFPLWRAREL